MVKGRRVRAVVACARNDDCCSPNPKRRGQKIAFERAVLQPNKTNTITAFFQSVDVEIDEKKPSVEDELQVKPNDGDIVLALAHDVKDVTSNNVPTTPVIQKKKMTCNEGPPTPHRIELADDVVKDGVKAELPVPKTKRRLNNCHATSQNNHKVTEFFPVRRSVRKTKKTVMEEKQRSLEQLLRNEVEEGLEIRIFDDKGRGVVAAKPFTKGDFVVEYSGDLIDLNEAKRRELKYAQDLSAGCYMYYFKHNNQQYCVDATAESGKLGRLVNHSRNGNLITRTISVDNKPRLVLIAKDDIKEGDEITYDYGDRSKESLKHHPWLAY